MKKFLAITAITALCANAAFAAEAYDKKQLTLDPNSFTIEEIAFGQQSLRDGEEQVDPQTPSSSATIPSPGQLPQVPSIPSVNTGGSGNGGNTTTTTGGGVSWDDINQGIDVADKIVNLMDKIMTLIAKNQPVVNITVNYANAVPYGMTHWTQLQGWSKPMTKRYMMAIKDSIGNKAVEVTYQVHWTYGGNYNGKGKYLTGVTVEPISVKTAYGYTVDMTAEVPDSTIANVGTTESPVASMQVKLHVKAHSIFSDMQKQEIYYVQGDGLMQPMTQKLAPVKTDAKTLEHLTKTIQNVKF